MPWTKKTYELVAHTLADVRDDVNMFGSRCTCDELAARFADTFEADNPRFDRARFMRAYDGREAA